MSSARHLIVKGLVAEEAGEGGRGGGGDGGGRVVAETGVHGEMLTQVDTPFEALAAHDTEEGSRFSIALACLTHISRRRRERVSSLTLGHIRSGR